MKLFSLLDPVKAGRSERLLALLLVSIAVGGLFYFWSYDPASPLVQVPPCPFRTLTGLYCPGCGSRSALIQLAHGNLYAAWRLNPLLILFLPAAGLFLLSQVRILLTGRSLPRLFLHPTLAWAIFYLILAYWIFRNIPLYPFNLLQPTIVN
ncbi:MAG: DUF2752 domain-containing protein [Dethiobacteria bacterium]|jgi:hypothetical protein|nr:DUF2752 domain-containing protein [Bacillota bacterium]NMD33603.1 DUF2752 domain-containing protein [Bacillota bacterium]HOB28508.1 DUF2752 domain-containing protein [Bacillota bacterium]HPZ41094.1 DUF2752 domain-containing protein [Bacillota bacterium]HQD52187.1 DUF2752 domain-containing protein [Bacillota bacterium]